MHKTREITFQGSVQVNQKQVPETVPDPACKLATPAQTAGSAATAGVASLMQETVPFRVG